MHSAHSSADNDALVSRTAADAKIRAGLRLFVGRGKRFSVKQLSNASGVADRAIECAMASDGPEFRPLSLDRLLSISSVIGPEFTVEWLGLASQGAFWLPNADETPPGEMAADNSEDNATLVRAAIDGVFNGDEKPVLAVVGKRMMARGAQLAALNDRAA